jgi:hypothetical protein
MTVAETCEQCGAPLASDQRYCLECGQRRGGPRIDYRHYMGGSGQPSEPGAPAEPAAPAPGEEPAKPQRDFAPLAAVGGIAVLGLMLLVGVLIGKGNGDSTAATPAPVVIKGPSGESSGSESGGSSKNSGGLNTAGKTKKAKKGGNGGTGNAVKPSTSELEAHSNASGESYEKESENLPNEIATPGKPPPIDTSKPPGGGEGGAEVIK